MTLPWLPDEAALRCFPLLTSGSAYRSPRHLEAVLEQFEVETHPRYQRTPAGITKCSTFLWDVSRAMGCELAKDYGAAETVFDMNHANPRTVIVKRERTLNELIAWLHGAGISIGFRFVAELDARAAANAGKFAMALWKNPHGDPGHGAVLRPQPSDRDPNTWIAQAGSKNFLNGTLQSGFASLPVEFCVRD